MKRRTLLTAGSLGLGAALAACGGPQSAKSGTQTQDGSPASPAVLRKKARTLRLVTAWPKNFPGLGTVAEEISQNIGTLSGGTLAVKLYAAGELVPAHEEFDAVSSGAADMYHASEYYWMGKSKGFAFFTAVPFGMTAIEQLGWINDGGGKSLWDKLSARFNLIALPAGSTGHQMGGWFKKEINTLDDLKGLIMRIPGLGGDVMRELGVSPKLLAGGAIYQALQSGAIDATEWVGPWNDMAFGFYREAPYYYGPGFHEPGSTVSLGFNLEVWNSLSSQEQIAVKGACGWAMSTSLAQFSWQNAKALKTLRDEHGVQVRNFSDEIWKALGIATKKVLAEVGQSDPETQAIHDSYMAALHEASAWAQVSDGPYLRLRSLAGF
ncbi:MAG: ABC transporter substrate-binding protein [Robiginitomaculum sp.]|nr:MAG: ABC transporter substrate-binding protein [Robiginitomaculum sp.]